MSDDDDNRDDDVKQLRDELAELRAGYDQLKGASTEAERRSAKQEIGEQEDRVAKAARELGVSREDIERMQEESEYRRTSRHLDRWLEENPEKLAPLEPEPAKPKPKPKPKAEQPKENEPDDDDDADDPPEPEPHWSERRVGDLLR